MNRDEDLMRIAVKEAYAGIDAGHGGPFGAVIARGNDIISSEHNTVIVDNDPVRHAEINAISAAAGSLASHDLSGCVIYTTTEPCPMCFSAIHWARIDEIIYGTEITDVKELGFNELLIPSEEMKNMGQLGIKIRKGFFRDDCIKLLRYWEKSGNKIVY